MVKYELKGAGTRNLFDPNGKGFKLFLPKQTDEINH